MTDAPFEFIAPHLVLEGRQMAEAISSLPLPDLRSMTLEQRKVAAWIELKRQMGALRLINELRWKLNVAAPTKATRSRP